MKLSSESLDILSKVVCGDLNSTPYMSGTV